MILLQHRWNIPASCIPSLKRKLKIGTTGVSIEMNGLVPDNLSGNTKYLDPLVTVNNMAAQLKQKHRCDVVICLSHLGYHYQKETNPMMRLF